MPAYHYIGLNQEQKELSGVIEAPDEQFARKKLNQLNLSVVSINQIENALASTLPAPSGKTTFEFEAFDKNKKKVVGTIVADTPLKAYARLFEEYQLNVVSLVSAALPAHEKEAAKAAGIIALQKEYQAVYAKGSDAEAEEKRQTQEAATQEARKELLDKVDYTMKKVEQFIVEFSADLKVEERQVIQAYINQLIRIKDSTNLEHIRSTCERMLDHLQKREIFLHEEQKMSQSTKLKMETKELLSDLKRTGLSKDIDLVKTAMRLQENPFLKPFAQLVLRLFKAKNPEVVRLRDEVKMVNRHVWAYVKILLTGKTRELKNEAWQSIKTLREEKKRLKLQIHSLLLQEKSEAAKNSGYVSEQAGAALGWILSFYILTYIVSYPFTIKQFNDIELPRNLHFYSSQLPKLVTIFLFLAYGAVTVRNLWLRNTPKAALLIYPVTFFAFLLIVVNLM